MLLIIGCFMEALAAMLILIPILAPAAASYGIDPVMARAILPWLPLTLWLHSAMKG